MSDVNSAVLDFLGLTSTVQSVKNAVTATKQGVEVLNAWQKLMATPAGKEFKQTLVAIIGGSKVSADGTLHIDAPASAPHEAQKPKVARGHWEQGPWDPFKGADWVWVEDK